jgi:hypothetical protein
MSKELRHNAEQRLKAGTLSVLVATASLELGVGNRHRLSRLGSAVFFTQENRQILATSWSQRPLNPWNA